jgi:CYTH domain-containing protein
LTREIERRFLLERLPADLPGGTPVRQGYVALEGDVSVRVRDAGGARTLTVKGGTGRERVEVERPLDAEEFEALWQLSEGRRIAKVRSVVPLGEHRAEVDVFEGELDGLWIAEVEFPSSEAADAFEPPAWFGEEITNRPEWGNPALAVHGRPDGR